MLACLPVPSLTRSSSGLAARANRRTVLRDRPSPAVISRVAAALGQQPVHVSVPGPGPDGDPPGPRRPRRGRRLGCRRGRWPGPAPRPRRQVLAVPADRPLDRLAEVVPQVPAVGDLDRLRRAAGAAVGVDPGPVPADHLRSRPGRQPGGERVRRPLAQDVDGPAGLDVDQQRPVTAALAQRELIHAQHPRRRADGRVGHRPDQADQRHPAHAGR